MKEGDKAAAGPDRQGKSSHSERGLVASGGRGQAAIQSGKRAFLARFPVPETRREDRHCHLPNEAGVTDVTDLTNLNHVP